MTDSRRLSKASHKLNDSRKKSIEVEAHSSQIKKSKLSLQASALLTKAKSGAKSAVVKEPANDEHINDPLFWGPYLSERQWGTVREDYSFEGCNNWDYLNHGESRKQAYAWGEDGLLGISDKFGLLCASFALWNHKDPILKERLFGLTGNEGNHGEDVKELYYYLDNTPKHNYMRACYKYPQSEFPYSKILQSNGSAMDEPEIEILDLGVFESGKYWSVAVEYAKSTPSSLICCLTVHNCSKHTEKLDLMPQFYFRNTWSKKNPRQNLTQPSFQAVGGKEVDAIYDMGIFRINFHTGKHVRLNSLLFTNNNSVNSERGYDQPNETNPSMHGKKDAFHNYIIKGEKEAVTSDGSGTKFCAWMTIELEGNTKTSVYWQIFPADSVGEPTIPKLDRIIQREKQEALKFYSKVIPQSLNPEEVNICKQAIAGLLWSKQFYSYNLTLKAKELLQLHSQAVLDTTAGKKLNSWKNINCADILLMPDKWEFPWFAAWDLAFHCVQYCRLDVQFAKEQILILLSDRYMHTNGQIPGCEFDFGDPNPPLMAWAVWKIYNYEGRIDASFLKTCYNRLIFTFQWWNRMDPTNLFLYGNGFMGMDNISILDRSKLPHDALFLKQADCTGWMGNFCLMMLKISLELAANDKSYTDMSIKFFKHYLCIAKAINHNVEDGGLWCEEDNFFYDVLHYQAAHTEAIRIKSWSGIVPLLACTTIDLKNNPLVKAFLLKCDSCFAPYVCKLGDNEFFLSLVSYTKLKSILVTVFSTDEFLSPYGIRSLSKIYKDKPYNFHINGINETLTYVPGESDSKLFGGNSNWRGPIWLCMNYLLVECLEKYADLDKIFTLPLMIKYPTGAASKSSFLQIAEDLCKRIISIFLPNHWGFRPLHGNQAIYSNDPEFEHLVLFYEYFHADTGRGCGASHQTWTGLVLEFIIKQAKAIDALKKKTTF